MRAGNVQRDGTIGPDDILEWTPELESGVDAIDRQHRSLLQEASRLLQSAKARAPDTLARFDGLLSHILGHFRDEEECLRLANYSGLDRHRRLHAALAEEALRLREEMLAGRHAYAQLLSFLVHDVVENHLLVEDRDFFPVVRQAQQPRARRPEVSPPTG